MGKEKFESLYKRYNRREFIHPDPLEFLYRYDNLRDREIAGLIAASLSYGRVNQILNSAGSVLDKMPSPYDFLADSTERSIRRTFTGFKHRFTTDDDLVNLLCATKRAVADYGSLQKCFVKGLEEKNQTILPALSRFVSILNAYSVKGKSYLLPCPSAGSACKRMNLFLRWMVRQDDVDPGGWYNVPASKLVIPLDIHMHRICAALSLTERKQPDLRTALEITDAFRKITPDDPVRYDFCLTRLGIRPELDAAEFIKQCRAPEVCHGA